MLQAFVAELRSNPDFTSVVREKAGVLPCFQRDLSMKRIHKSREQSQIFHKIEKQKQRRKVTKQVRAHLMGKDEKKSEKNSTDKVKPLTASIKQSTAKKARKCGNCGLICHTRVDCVQPDNIPQTKE